MPKKTQLADPNWLEAPVVRIYPAPTGDKNTPKVGETQTCHLCKQDATFNGVEWLHRHDGTPYCVDPISIEERCRRAYIQLHPDIPFVYEEFREWTRRMGINQANLS